MKKILLIMTLILFCNAPMSLAGDEVVGIVKSIDLKTRKIYVTKPTGDTSVAYSTDTKWPQGMSDASDWVGKKVTVTIDSLSKFVSEVEEYKEPKEKTRR